MPEEPSLILLAISLIFLLILSAFFSGSETGMMASNKIKLRNKVKKGSNSSKRALELLSRPDNLLSVILVGNNFANILASAIVTIIMINFFEGRVLLGSVLLTIIILIFSEITPKTTASAYPEEFASKSSWLLDKFSRILNPFILTNLYKNLFKIFRVQGNSMLPSFRPNDLVLCLKLKKYRMGSVVIVKNSDHGPILKRIKGIRDSRLEISSENKEYSSETTKITYDLDDVIGKVLFNLSKLNFFNFKL